MDWDTQQRWRAQVERQLNKVSSLVRGNQAASADRIADVIEQIDELRQQVAKIDEMEAELKAVKARLDKMAKWIQDNVPAKGTGK